MGRIFGWPRRRASDIIPILINANLVNKFMLPIHLVILGNGIPLYKDMEKQSNLQLLGSNTFKSGFNANALCRMKSSFNLLVKFKEYSVLLIIMHSH